MVLRKDDIVMTAICELCDGTDGCLVSRADILPLLPKRWRPSGEGLDDALAGLQRDGYFDLISSERKGEKMYVISLRESGLRYGSLKARRRRDAAYKMALAFAGVLATFVFGLILRAIFGQ